MFKVHIIHVAFVVVFGAILALGLHELYSSVAHALSAA